MGYNLFPSWKDSPRDLTTAAARVEPTEDMDIQVSCFQPLFYPCACEQPISLLQLEQYCLWGVQTAWGASGGKPCSRMMRRVSVLSPAKHAKS